MSDCDPKKCAYLLSKLDYVDLEKIMFSESFDLNILEHCFYVEQSSIQKVLLQYIYFTSSKDLIGLLDILLHGKNFVKALFA